jgi:hypothetical protein
MKVKIKAKIYLPVILLLLLCYFLVFPILSVGWWCNFAADRKINSIAGRILKKVYWIKDKKLSKEWFERIIKIDETEIPIVDWVEDSLTSKNLDSFYCLDQQSEDISMLQKAWNLPCNKGTWWNVRRDGKYFFTPDKAPLPIYEMERTDSTLHITTGSKENTWIYLAAKEKQPKIYRLDFDFVTHTKTSETLQICFAANSLANRFRFNLLNNSKLSFQVVDHAVFTGTRRPGLWSSLQTPYSIELHKKTHVSLLCLDNKFALYFDNELMMAVEIKDYQAKPDYWFLICWNGFDSRANQKFDLDNHMEIEISNLKIYHPK